MSLLGIGLTDKICFRDGGGGGPDLKGVAPAPGIPGPGGGRDGWIVGSSTNLRFALFIISFCLLAFSSISIFFCASIIFLRISSCAVSAASFSLRLAAALASAVSFSLRLAVAS